MPKSDRPVIKPVLHHWGMRTIKFDEMVAWYETVLGLETVFGSPSPVPVAFVTNDEEHHRGGFFNIPGLVDSPERARSIGLNHIGWNYDSLDDLLDTWSRLQEEGIKSIVDTDHGPTFSIYYKDPEDNTVELTCLSFDTLAQAVEACQDPVMIANPMGAPFVPEKLIQARKDGLSLSEIHEKTMAHEYAPEGPPPGPELIM